ncbi:MAG: cytochrome P450 [Novosphingobium sp.]|nr:cytochrome P450 [Novosphingobium sp.]
MLYESRSELPDHVPPSLVVDHDVFTVDAPDGDFAGAMVRLRESDVPALFWTQRNGGHWVATDGEQIRTILVDPERFSSRAMRVPKAANPVPPIIPLMIDPPDHVQYRRLIAPAMTPAKVRKLEGSARALSIGIIEQLEPKGACEFVSEFAQQMPIAIFMGMLDLPASDQPVIMDIVDRIIRPDVPETRMCGFADLVDYTMARVAERRAEPGDDLVSSLAHAKIDGRPLRDDELQGLMFVLLLAGLDTVAAMLTYITCFLAGSSDHRRELQEKPELITEAIEEFLRRMAMVNLTREVNRDTELGGIVLKAGDLIVCPSPLCNFPEDGTDWLAVDFHRPRQVHATFGAGPHYCLGSMLARAEIRIFLEEWLARIPDFAIEEGAQLEVKAGAAVMIPRLPLVWRPRGKTT